MTDDDMRKDLLSSKYILIELCIKIVFTWRYGVLSTQM